MERSSQSLCWLDSMPLPLLWLRLFLQDKNLWVSSLRSWQYLKLSILVLTEPQSNSRCTIINNQFSINQMSFPNNITHNHQQTLELKWPTSEPSKTQTSLRKRPPLNAKVTNAWLRNAWEETAKNSPRTKRLAKHKWFPRNQLLSNHTHSTTSLKPLTNKLLSTSKKMSICIRNSRKLWWSRKLKRK